MNVLLDTHTLLWWLFGARDLSPEAHDLLADRGNRVLVSAASAWEIATKVRLGRLPDAVPLVEDFSGWVAKAGFEDLPVTARHATKAGLLSGVHRDPFDRMLAAQGIVEGVEIVSCDTALAELGAKLRW